MKLLGVTIGAGQKFALMAEQAAALFRFRTGRAAVVLGVDSQSLFRLARPHHLKFELFRIFPHYDAIAFFDADMVFLEWFSPEEMLGDDGFGAARDLWQEPWIIEDARRANVQPQNYFNSGFFVIHRDRAPILDLARRLQAVIDTPFKDQTFLNAAANNLGIAVNYFPGRFNLHVDREFTPNLDHVAGAHMHWIKDEDESLIPRYYHDPRTMFWRGVPPSPVAGLCEGGPGVIDSGYNKPEIKS